MKTAERVSAEDVRGTDVFAGLPNDSLERIANSCSHSVYEAGEYLATQDEKMDRLLIVNGGKVAVEMRVEVARHTHAVTIATLGRGKVCAWSALVPPNVLTASVRCVERAHMISIGASDLQRILEQEPSLGYMVMKNLAAVISSRLRESRIQLERLVAEVMKQGE